MLTLLSTPFWIIKNKKNKNNNNNNKTYMDPVTNSSDLPTLVIAF